YYQVLNVERGGDQDKIKSSFHQLLNLLYPPYIISSTLPAEINARVERAFTKAAQAFAVLASFSRRKEYDEALLSIASKPVAPAVSTQTRVNHHQSGPPLPSDSSAANWEGEAIRRAQHQAVYSESSGAKQGDNRRRCGRFKLSIPVRVTGYDRNIGKWHEMTETVDVSRTGVKLRLRRPVKHGTVLFLTLPLPEKLRGHGFSEQTYNVYTLVRRVEPPRQGVRAVGVEFLGQHPPRGFLDKPWAIFRSTRGGDGERRRPNRELRSEKVRLEYFDESMKSLSAQEGQTENVSRKGLRIVVSSAPTEFDLIMVTCRKLNFEGLAALRSRYQGKDGFERLCLQLIDKEWPS
ncbi:MAG: PilZ domain-containing protein, partial [Blastocatellia bacterium]